MFFQPVGAVGSARDGDAIRIGPGVFRGGITIGKSLTIRGTRFDHNSVTANIASTEDVGPSGTIVEFDGPAHVTQSSITNNTVKVTAQDGTAGASGGLAVFDFSDNPRQVTVSSSIISGNRAVAYSPHSPASIIGAGILNNSLLELDYTTTPVTVDHTVIAANHPGNCTG
jgi:hypothetical protein